MEEGARERRGEKDGRQKSEARSQKPELRTIFSLTPNTPLWSLIAQYSLLIALSSHSAIQLSSHWSLVIGDRLE